MNNHYRRFNRAAVGRLMGVAVLALACLEATTHAADSQNISAHITYRIEEGIYVDAGADKGLSKGLTGQLVLEDGSAYDFEVMQAANGNALLRLQGLGSELAGELEMLPVGLIFVPEETEDEEGVEEKPSAGNGTVQEVESFIPLLSPQKQAPAITQSKNVSHGSVGVSHSLLTGTDSGQDRMVTRLYTSGNTDRLFGSGWSFNWSANARYRTGDGYRDHPEYETIQPLIYSVMMQHPLAGEGFVRFGRFLPFELPGVGYLDGAQIETDTGGSWRFGIMSGLKPSRINLEASSDEPTVVGYTTFEAGSRGNNYYTGTAGVLGSLFQGEANRLALLFDQRASVGNRLNLFSSAEFDFGVADTTNSTTQLSRFDLTTSYKISHEHTLRAGADHWERADTPVERDRLEVIVDDLFNDGYWRYWIGARHRLPWNLRLNEEVAYTVSDATEDAMRWRASLTRTGIFDWKSANVAATVYNLESMGSSGMGWLLSSYLPFYDDRISLRPAASMRWLDPDDGGDGFSMSYYALYLDARIYKSWLLTGGITQTTGDGTDSTMFDLGLRYRW